MESGFDQLEQKVKKAADVVRSLRAENKSLQEELGRVKSRSGLPELARRLRELPPGAGAAECRVDEVHLVRSELRREGSHYTILGRFPLRLEE